MTDADKLNRVINSLEFCLKGLSDLCPYRNSDAPGGCRDELMYDAMTLLKKQKARVLAWDELIMADHIYVETNSDGRIYIVPGMVTVVHDAYVIAAIRVGSRVIDGRIDKDVYGMECRCWTSRPAKQQREAVKWHGDD